MWDFASAKLCDPLADSERGPKRRFDADRLARDINNLAAKSLHLENDHKRVKAEDNECESVTE